MQFTADFNENGEHFWSEQLELIDLLELVVQNARPSHRNPMPNMLVIIAIICSTVRMIEAFRIENEEMTVR